MRTVVSRPVEEAERPGVPRASVPGVGDLERLAALPFAVLQPVEPEKADALVMMAVARGVEPLLPNEERIRLEVE